MKLILPDFPECFNENHASPSDKFSLRDEISRISELLIDYESGVLLLKDYQKKLTSRKRVLESEYSRLIFEVD